MPDQLTAFLKEQLARFFDAPTMPDEGSDDATFWARQLTIQPEHDHPSSLLNPSPPQNPPLYLLISTPSGKPLYYFSHPKQPSQRAVLSLSAAISVFQSKTSVRCISLDEFVALSYPLSPYLTLIWGAPQVLMHNVVERIIVAVKALLSHKAADFLSTGRHITLQDGQKALLTQQMNNILTFPLPYITRRIPVLPSPNNRINAFSKLKLPPSCPNLLVTTASPPHPRRLLYSSSALSYDDISFCLSLPPPRADDTPNNPSTIFLPSTAYKVGFHAHVHSSQLRLHPDQFVKFQKSVGGSDWRPEWNAAGGHVVWLIFLSYLPLTQDEVFDVEDQLDRSELALDIMVSMERPFFQLNDDPDVKAVVVLQNGTVACTDGAWSYDVASAVQRIVAGEEIGDDGRGLVVIQERKVIWHGGVKERVLSNVIKRSGTLPAFTRNQGGKKTPLRGFLAPFDT